jgi:hypothetical protein
MFIASLHAGAETILFEEATFPADAPATIHLGEQTGLPIAPGTLCIDARHRGVVLDFGADTGCSVGCMLHVGAGSLLVGLTLLNIPYELEPGTDTQVAGCRFGTDGLALHQAAFSRFWAIDAYSGSHIGPGNVIASGITGVRNLSVGVTIEGNYFGVDVLTRRLVGEGLGIDFEPVGDLESSVIANNVFATPQGAIRANYGQGVIRGNLVGVDRDG